MPEPVTGSQRYHPGLDGLRALAVGAVVAYHVGWGWAQGGLLGVGVFFTLSGYLITDLLLGQQEMTGRLHLADFWLRRARRLLPGTIAGLPGQLGVCGGWFQAAGLVAPRPRSIQRLRGLGVLSPFVRPWRILFARGGDTLTSNDLTWKQLCVKLTA